MVDPATWGQIPKPPDIIEVELLTVAREIAQSAQHQLSQTATEMAELERQLLQLKIQWEGQLHADTRVAAYRPKLAAREYACPNCWIVYGQAFVLIPVAFNSPTESVLRCQSCGRDYGLLTNRD